MKIVNKNDTVGAYRLTMKFGSDNTKSSSIIDIMKELKDNGYNIIIYEPLVEKKYYDGIKMVNDFDEFVDKSDLIIANRIDCAIEKYKEKVYSRDLYRRD